MPKLRVACFTVSLDGYGAGSNQDIDNPLGTGIERCMPGSITRTVQKLFGKDEGTTGIDNDFAERGTTNLGAWILGRNMFGPIRGPWKRMKSWKGWWGPNPPVSRSRYRADAPSSAHQS